MVRRSAGGAESNCQPERAPGRQRRPVEGFVRTPFIGLGRRRHPAGQRGEIVLNLWVSACPFSYAFNHGCHILVINDLAARGNRQPSAPALVVAAESGRFERIIRKASASDASAIWQKECRILRKQGGTAIRTEPTLAAPAGYVNPQVAYLLEYLLIRKIRRPAKGAASAFLAVVTVANSIEQRLTFKLNRTFAATAHCFANHGAHPASSENTARISWSKLTPKRK